MDHWQEPECRAKCAVSMELEDTVIRDDGVVLARFRCPECRRTTTQVLNKQEEVVR